MYARYTKAFTLIELLVVIAIIGILASVVLASLSDARASARDVQRLSEARQLQTALELFYNAVGRYPLDSVDRGGGNTYNFSDIQNDIVPDYIPSVPADDEFNYGSSSDGSSYSILIQLERNSTYCKVDGPSGSPHWNTQGYPQCF